MPVMPKPIVRRRAFLTLAALLVQPLAGVAYAATATSTFTVQMTVTSSCVINSASTLNFGSQGVLVANVDNTSTLQVQCTNTTPYNIGLDAGQGTGATVAVRKMTNGASTIKLFALQRQRPHHGVGQHGRNQYDRGDRQWRVAELHRVWPRAAADHAGGGYLHRHDHGDRHLLTSGRQ
jgi:spore coat protein U-like protein